MDVKWFEMEISMYVLRFDKDTITVKWQPVYRGFYIFTLNFKYDTFNPFLSPASSFLHLAQDLSSLFCFSINY